MKRWMAAALCILLAFSLTQEPTGVKGYDWCAVFTAPQPEGPWSFLSTG